MTGQLETQAHAAAVSAAAVNRAAAAVAEAEKRHDATVARMAELAADRAAIVARRAAGDVQSDDGARLALLAADAEGLTELAAPAAAALRAARDAEHAAVRAKANAEAGYVAEEARAEILALDAHADHLLDLLRQTTEQRRAASATLQPGERDFARSVAHLQRLDGLLSAELEDLRAVLVGPVREAFRVTWKPSYSLYSQVWRLHEGGGRLS